ncbi:hypothetical protein P2318_24405 [Myxococcaceae bacterium GXIMD 01537]
MATWTCALALLLAPCMSFARAAAEAAPQEQSGMGLDLSAPSSQEEQPSPSLGLDLSSDAPPAPAGPRILVVPPVRGTRLDLKAHQRVLTALAARYGARLVPADATARAVRDLRLTAATALEPEAIVRLAERVGAERAISLEVSRRDLLVRVYAPPDPSVIVGFQADGAGALNAKESQQLATELGDRAASALDPPPPPAPAPEPAPVVAEAETPIVDQDLLDENRAARRAAASGPAVPLGTPRVWVALGGGADLRTFGVTGPATEILAPVETRPVPQLAVALEVFPLQFLDPSASAVWSDAVVEGRFRRSLTKVTYEKEGGGQDSCGLDDDALLVRAAWRYRFGGRAPSVGVGVGWASERSEFDCPVPVVSMRYRALEASVRARQLLWNDRVVLDALVGPRIVLSGPTADQSGTALMGELGASFRLNRYFFTRLHARLVSTRLGQTDRVEIDDSRTTLGLELGVTL